MPEYVCPDPTPQDPTQGVPFPRGMTGGERVPSVLHCRAATRTEITHTLVEVLRFHWANAEDTVAHPSLRRLSSSPTAPKTNYIQIYAEGDETVTAGFLPSLVVRSGARQSAGKIAIGNRTMVSPLGFPPGGNPSFGLKFMSFHTVVCMAGLQGEVELLAEEVIDVLGVSFASELRRQLNLDRFDYVRDDEPAKDDGAWVVPVAFGWYSQKSAEIRPDVPTIRGTVVETSPRRMTGGM